MPVDLLQWAPTNETAYDLYVERTNFDGFHLGSFAYGEESFAERSQPAFFYSLVTYVGLMFFFGTLGNSANIKLSELAFVDNRMYPGGPNAYLLEQSSLVEINLVGYVMYISATWMQDGFLLYRFFVVFDRNAFVLIIPCAVYLLSIVSSILLLVQLFDSAALSSGSTANFAIIYWSSSITTTLLLTCLIVGKLMHMRYSLLRAFGAYGVQNTPYLSISAMLIESALLYSLFALAFLILFVRNDPFQNVVFPALGQVQIISPQLIILRVAEGRSFTSSTMRTAPFGQTTINAHSVPGLATMTYGVNPVQTSSDSAHVNEESLEMAFTVTNLVKDRDSAA